MSPVLTGSPMMSAGAVLRNVNGMPLSMVGNGANQQQQSQPPQLHHQQSHDITIPNDWVGCVIGRGGVKINEIRHLSGAVIKISPCEDGKKERNISIQGSPDAVNVALYLIQTRISAELLTSGGFCMWKRREKNWFFWALCENFFSSVNCLSTQIVKSNRFFL